MIYTKTFAKANHIRLLFISLFLSPITLLRTDPQDVTLPPRDWGFGFGIGDWDLGLGLGLGIRIGIGDWDWDWG